MNNPIFTEQLPEDTISYTIKIPRESIGLSVILGALTRLHARYACVLEDKDDQHCWYGLDVRGIERDKDREEIETIITRNSESHKLWT